MIDPGIALETTLRDRVVPEQGRIPAFIFSDPTIYRVELERIFQRVWLFVAHVSEVPQRGDYVKRNMGEQTVIVAHGEDDMVRVFLNYCRHRGMELCRSELGNTSHFRCPYHGFTYSYTGALTGVPFQREAYVEGLERSALSLVEARVEMYQGLIFATWTLDGPSLHEYLGDIAWYLDVLVGRAEMEVVGPPQRWRVPTGWKLPSENFCSDAYHTAHTHASIVKLDLITGGTSFGASGYHVHSQNGHGLGLGTQAGAEPPYPPEMRAEFEQRLSAPQLALLDRLKNLHGNVFPNLSFLIPTAIHLEGREVWSTTLRLWQPRSVDSTEVVSWCLVEKNAPDWWKRLSRQSYIETFGISGMFEQDDTENWESMTRNSRGALSRNGETDLNYTMGIGRAPMQDFAGPGVVYDGKYSEENARRFYRTWLDYMVAGS
ncbi:MAG: aromatic ring-hydroxylating dioxygenase subunit alpha [Chloroflexi bacterium]|nr:aromatic ring-hydroxylating dioxygenase subunit alpha [Chloroflexota bacterium]